MKTLLTGIALLGLTTTRAFAELCGGELVAVSTPTNSPPASIAVIAKTIGATGVLLIGERHGVRDHPKAAACLIEAVAAQAAPAVVMEMITPDQAPALNAYRAAHPEIADGLGAQLQWWKTGWPSWPIYAPLFDTVWHTRSSVIAGDLAKAAILNPPGQIEAAFGAKIDATRTSWREAMSTAHCNLIDDTKALTLADRQINRDFAMARAITQARASAKPVVLYAGRAHVRNDRSVGFILRNAAKPVAPVLSVALQETAVAGAPIDRQAILAEAKGRYDYVWFTGVAERADACERLRAKGLIPTAGTKSREGSK